jgi:hypothetical protein
MDHERFSSQYILCPGLIYPLIPYEKVAIKALRKVRKGQDANQKCSKENGRKKEMNVSIDKG